MPPFFPIRRPFELWVKIEQIGIKYEKLYNFNLSEDKL